ncbi:YigZ family protein [Flammeovirgaceae bacterium SG7u.111]|nr:YigZ family protein [Flammeovirgaceae bacterium SG7u.132]WPO33972.1 YigZ family protein [Flammeovirgaceae bacterium SG7u.111]
MEDTYLSIDSPSEGFYKEKGSKFLAYAYPVKTEDQVKEKIQELKKKYYDARHHCYAFMMGRKMDRFRAADDGEPGNSAGAPILGQIRSRELTDVLVVVVRYFGGTKLGVSGLINAYKTSAAEALENAEIIEKIITETLSMTFEYPQMNDVMKVVKDYDLNILKQEFTMDCIMEVEVREKLLPEVRAKLEKVDGLRL